MKTAFYIRRSHKRADSQINSHNVQEACLLRFAKENGLEVAATYFESASGLDSARPVFKQCLEDAKANGWLVTSFRPDRLGRAATLIPILEQFGCENLRFVSMGNQTPDWFTLRIMLLVAEQESRAISIRTKATYAYMKENNLEGYQNWGRGDSSESLKRGLKTRKENAATFNTRIQNIVDSLEGGAYLTLAAKVAWLNSNSIFTRRGKPWSIPGLHRTLKYNRR